MRVHLWDEATGYERRNVDQEAPTSLALPACQLEVGCSDGAKASKWLARGEKKSPIHFPLSDANS